MADVEIVATYELFNINRAKLENLIHRVFESAQLDIEIKDRFGNPVAPREILSLLAQAHAHRETRIFQAKNGIPVPLWWALIGFTAVLSLFVSLSGIKYRMTAVAMAACFTAGIVSILVVAQLLDYPFEGALLLEIP